MADLMKLQHTVYKYKGVIVIKCPNGLYKGQFFVKDLPHKCVITAWSQEDYVRQFNQFIEKHGGLELDKYILGGN